MLLYVCTAIVVCGRIGSVGGDGYVEIVEIPQGEAERAFKDETLSKEGCDQGTRMPSAARPRAKSSTLLNRAQYGSVGLSK